MKVFISWSGDRSRAVAAALKDWLPRVIQAVEPFFSPEIEKGARWSGELDAALEGTQFGIVCLTSDNLASPWLHYETGALSKATDALVWTFLLDVTPGDVAQPLGRFQHTLAEKRDVLKLVQTINLQLGQQLGEQLLTEIFEDAWPRLERQLSEAVVITPTNSQPEPPQSEGRGDRELLEEILEMLRTQNRTDDIVQGVVQELEVLKVESDKRAQTLARIGYEVRELPRFIDYLLEKRLARDEAEQSPSPAPARI